MSRYEWTGTDGRKRYVEKTADGVVATNASPGDFEAHEELLRIAAVLDFVRDDKRGAIQAARAAMQALQIVGRENDLLRAGPSAAQVLGHASLKRQLAEWQREAARRSKAHLELHGRYLRKRKKVRKLRRRIEELEMQIREEGERS